MFETLYSPESQGLSSEGITKFINELTGARLCTHGLLLLRHGKPVMEAYEAHFSPERTHRMYSVSKTFTSAAVGILIGEGKLSLDSGVADYFKDKYEGELHPFIAATTVRDLLIMATPFDETTYEDSDADWVKTFFNTEPSHAPGSIFNYDTSGTLVLCALIERITGMPFEEYLYEKALKYIGYTKAPKCVKEPGGVSWGGSGIICTLRELAAFSQLFLNGGRTPDGRQVIPEDYVREATAKQISNEQKNAFSSYGCHGYGYQIWRTVDGFAFLGMGNQLSVFLPEQDILLCTTSDDQGNATAREIIFRALRDYIAVPASDSPLPEAPEALAALREAQKTLKMPLPIGVTASPLQEEYNGRQFTMRKNPMGITSLRLDFGGDRGALTLGTPRGEKVITFGTGYFDDSEFPEPQYSGNTINTPMGKGYECHSAAVWAQPDKLIIRSYLTDDYFGNLTATVSFKGGKPSILFTKTAEWFLREYSGFAAAE